MIRGYSNPLVLTGKDNVLMIQHFMWSENIGKEKELNDQESKCVVCMCMRVRLREEGWWGRGGEGGGGGWQAWGDNGSGAGGWGGGG